MNITTTPPQEQFWKYLDDQYYILQCIKRGIGISSRDPDYLAAHYAENAAEHELSPNPFFSERYYRFKYADVASAITSGQYTSGFDHFDKVGSLTGLSPHWFFDGAWYAERSPDLTPQTLQANGLNDVYGHFLASGLAEKRAGNWFHAAMLKVSGAGTGPTNVTELREILLDPQSLARWLAPLFDAAWFAAKSKLNVCVSPVPPVAVLPTVVMLIFVKFSDSDSVGRSPPLLLE